MTKQLISPLHFQYTTLERLKKFKPFGFTSELLVVKELLDNACDAAENAKNGNWVNIDFSGGMFKVTNPGIISRETLYTVVDFSLTISEKYCKRGFIRGQIGHGLKIALMLFISDESQIKIKSGPIQYTIILKNRFSKHSKGVLGIEEKDHDNAGNTTVEIPFSDNPEQNHTIEDYILKYIALNPQITFRYNPILFNKTIDLKKNCKADVFSYEEEDFDGFIDCYRMGGFTSEDFVNIFNVKKTNFTKNFKKHSFSDNPGDLFKFMKKNSKKIPRPLLGETAIKDRVKDVFKINCKEYKKFRVNKGFIEIAYFENKDTNPFVVTGVNGSCVMPNAIRFPGCTISDLICIDTNNSKTKYGMLISYYATSINYWGSNKDMVFISEKKVRNAIANLIKKPSHQKEEKSSSWLLKKNDYASDIYEDEAELQKAKDLGISPPIYCFIRECKAIAESMRDRYGLITIRQLYYQLVSKKIIVNSQGSYDNFNHHLTTAREKDLIDYEIFEDRSRYIITPASVSMRTDSKDHIKKIIKMSLNPPDLDIWENQQYYVEIWIEKDALVRLFSAVTNKMQVALFPSRGYTSVTKIEEARKRFKENAEMKRKKGILLYAGDLDPSGMDIYQNIRNKFKNEGNIEIKRFALNQEQVGNLAAMPIKPTDTRYSKFLQMHPGLKGAYELDAFDPDELKKLTEKNIKDYFDSNIKAGEEEIIKEWHEGFAAVKNEILKKLEI